MERTHAAFLVLLSLAAAVFPQLTNENSPIGANFWLIYDPDTRPFTNHFAITRPFYSQSATGAEDGKPLALNRDGYPVSLLSGQSATTKVFPGKLHPVGKVVCLYEGDGDITFASNNPPIVSREPGKIVLNLPDRPYDNDGGFLLKITRTNSANPVRNVRLFEESKLADTVSYFQPRFIELLRPFRVLRFMDWMYANTSSIKDWDDRPTAQSQTQAGPYGISIEYMVALCNELNADPWFCLPYAGTDDYYRQFASYARDHLKPNLKAYYEYCNEVWNPLISKGAAYCQEQGTALGLGSGWTAQHKYWAKRMTELMVIVEEVYAGHMDRCVRVIATQEGNTGVTDGLLSYYNSKAHGDVLATAPYMRPTGSSLSAVLDNLASEAKGMTARTAKDNAVAVKNGLRLVAYESGMELYYSGADRIAVRFDPRMSTIMADYFGGWKAGGGTLMCWYTFSSWMWGLVKSLAPGSEKAAPYQAALAFINANPRWWDERREPAMALRNEYHVFSPWFPAAPHSLLAVGVRGCERNGATLYRLNGRRAGAQAAWFWTPTGVYVQRR